MAFAYLVLERGRPITHSELAEVLWPGELPRHAWVDVEAAADAIHEAETALKAGDPRRWYGASAVAHHIARRPFFPGERGAWIEARRELLARATSAPLKGAAA